MPVKVNVKRHYDKATGRATTALEVAFPQSARAFFAHHGRVGGKIGGAISGPMCTEAQVEARRRNAAIATKARVKQYEAGVG